MFQFTLVCLFFNSEVQATTTETPIECKATEVAMSNKFTAGSITGAIGDTVDVICETGFSGSGTAICEANGIFKLPTCVGNFILEIYTVK